MVVTTTEYPPSSPLDSRSFSVSPSLSSEDSDASTMATSEASSKSTSANNSSPFSMTKVETGGDVMRNREKKQGETSSEFGIKFFQDLGSIDDFDCFWKGNSFLSLECKKLLQIAYLTIFGIFGSAKYGPVGCPCKDLAKCSSDNQISFLARSQNCNYNVKL